VWREDRVVAVQQREKQRLGDPDSSTDGGDPRDQDGLERQRLFGLTLVNAEAEQDVVESLMQTTPRWHPDVDPVVATPNVDILVQLNAHPSSDAANQFRRAQYVLPDGMPLVAVAPLLGARLKGRLAGSTLFSLLWPQLEAANTPVLAVCSSAEIGRLLARKTDNEFAHYLVAPMLDVANPQQLSEFVDLVVAGALRANAKFVILGIGHPKDATIIRAVLQRWPRDHALPMFLALGGSLGMYVGLQRRAPRWVQRVGMEWFFRFVQEPRRLFRRYFVQDMAFWGIVRREMRTARHTQGRSHL